MSEGRRVRGIRVLPDISLPMRQSVFEVIRSGIQKAAISWGVAYLMIFPDGSCLIVRRPPKCMPYFVGAYGKHFTSADLWSDIFHYVSVPSDQA